MDARIEAFLAAKHASSDDPYTAEAKAMKDLIDQLLTPDEVEIKRISRLVNKLRYQKNRAHKASYYATHREERIAYGAAWRASHREDCLAYAAAYRASHREERRAYDAARDAARRAAKKAGVKHHA